MKKPSRYRNFILLTALLLSFSIIGQTTKQYKRVNLDDSKMTEVEKIKYYNSTGIDSSKIGLAVHLFKATGFDGRPFRNDTTKRVAFYNFWLTSCAPCVAEMPMFNDLVRKYGEEVDFIAITYEEPEYAKKFFETHPFLFQHYRMEKLDIRNLTNSGYPLTILVVDGVIVLWKSGGAVPSSMFDLLMKDQLEHFSVLIEEGLQ